MGEDRTALPIAVTVPPLVPRGDAGAVMAFTGRAQGNLSLTVGYGDAGARARGLADLGLDLADAVFMQQVHGAAVRRVGLADRGRGAWEPSTAVPGTDALVTTDEGVALVVLVADCVPVLLAAPGAGVAAVHAGRRGVVAGVVGTAVEALAGAVGGHRADLVAVLGPAIGGCCYELPADVARGVTAVVTAARATTSWGTPAVDLRAAVTTQLHAAGVEQVMAVGGCTRCEPDRWFSHRAANGDRGPAGRQAGIVARAARHPRSPGKASLD